MFFLCAFSSFHSDGMSASNGYKYEESLTLGVFRGQLSDFSQSLAASRREGESSLPSDAGYLGPRWRKLTHFPRIILDFLRYKIGYDWLVLIILGVLMALLSASVDYVIDSLHTARLRVYDHANRINVFLSVSYLVSRYCHKYYYCCCCCLVLCVGFHIPGVAAVCCRIHKAYLY